MDPFPKAHTTALRLIDQLEAHFKARRQLIVVNKPTAKIDNLILSTFSNLKNSLQQMLADYHNLESDPKFPIQEKMRRHEILEDLKTKLKYYDDRIQEFSTSPFHKSPKKYRQVRAQHLYENEETKGLNNQQLYQAEQQIIDNQNEQLDQLHDQIKTIKYAGQEINKETHIHLNLIDNLSQDIDQAKETIVLVDSRMKKVIAKSSNCCLICIIFLQVLAILFILFLL